MIIDMPQQIERKIEEYVADSAVNAKFGELFELLDEWCSMSEKGIVLIIDEVDSATNNQVFLDFLSGLRDSYISRDTDGSVVFQSVILAGVTDVKCVKGRMRDEEKHKVNSPWNTRESNEESECLHSLDDCPRDSQNFFASIAADFSVDMSLSQEGIEGMLKEYEADHETGMNISVIAENKGLAWREI